MGTDLNKSWYRRAFNRKKGKFKSEHMARKHGHAQNGLACKAAACR